MESDPVLTIRTPAPISTLAFGHSSSVLLAGSDDCSIRLYDLPSTAVVKAIRGLAGEVSSIVAPVAKFKDGQPEAMREVWVACGRRARLFDLSNSALVLGVTNATTTLELGEDEDDALNELGVSANGKLLAFASDAGVVGVVELGTGQVTKMKVRHTNICGAIKFIPDRPSELVSGGYDSSLLHFDHTQRALLSRHAFAAPPPSADGSGLSFSPPFVLCTAMSPAGVLAAGTADGRLWIGTAGARQPDGGKSGKKKRARKWEGLRAEGSAELRVAEGPVVGVAFTGTNAVLTCSLLGTLALWSLGSVPDADAVAITKGRTWSVRSIAKVNALAVSERWIAVGGFAQDGKGVVEVWDARGTDGLPSPADGARSEGAA